MNEIRLTTSDTYAVIGAMALHTDRTVAEITSSIIQAMVSGRYDSSHVTIAYAAPHGETPRQYELTIVR